MIPSSGPSAARLKASLTSSTATSRPSTTARSVSEPSSTGTRSEMPSSLPLSSGMARLAALAALVVGVGVHRGHEAPLDAEGVQQHLGHRHHRVGGAGRVGDDVVAGGIVFGVVDAHHDGDVLALGRRGDDHLAGARLEVQGGAVAVGEAAGRLDHDVDAQVPPAELRRVTLGRGADRLAVHADRGFVEAHLAVEYTEGGVVLQQVRDGAVVGQVVDGHDLDVALAAAGSVACGAVEVAADAAEAVDAYSDGHAPSCCWRYSGLRGSGPRRRDRRRSRPLYRTAPRVVTRLTPPPPTGVSRRTT